MLKDYVFTSESVSEGHPDKICDQISDAVLDLYLSQAPEARVACETCVTTDFVCLLGETRGPSSITNDVIEQVARDTIRRIGYDQDGFSHRTAQVDIRLHAQSADIAVGVDATDEKEEGAGDQGIMFGYASRETDVLMPAPIHYSHAIMQSLAAARHTGQTRLLGPDAKAQVTLEYRNGKPVGATHIVVSTQHTEDAREDDVRELVRSHVLNILPEGWMCPEETFFVNPTGRFVIGGPVGDSGLTGRKIIVDTYGGACPHGGGAFSGKDPTKVDRSAAYAARYLAKNIVAAGYADTCTIQLSYAIGVAHPMSLYINTHGTGKVSETVLAKTMQDIMDLRPRGIRQHLGLNRPIYAPTAAYGHFGRTPSDQGHFTWEKTDLVAVLQKEIG
ncbi:MAG: methionine adenosyltransferase [Pseudomonadota bacterium]